MVIDGNRETSGEELKMDMSIFNSSYLFSCFHHITISRDDTVYIEEMVIDGNRKTSGEELKVDIPPYWTTNRDDPSIH